MNIAIEISPLMTASGGFGDKSGVYRYMYGIIDALINLTAEKDENAKIILFSFNRDILKYPLNPEILKFLSHKNVHIINSIPIFPEENAIDKVLLLDLPIIKPVLKILNNIIHIKSIFSNYTNRKRYQIYVNYLKYEFKKNKVKVIFHSETGFYPIHDFVNVITIYDLTAILMGEFHREQTVDLQKRKLEFTQKYCEGVICISNFTKKDLLALNGFSAKKIAVIYPGLDPVFKISKNQAGEKVTFSDINLILEYHKNQLESKKYLLYYGTFEPRKNLIYLVKAFVDLQRSNEIPNDYKLVLMGGEGWGHIKNTIRNFVKENFPIHSKNNIIILDFLSDDYICEFIKNAAVVVYPSLYEGFGLPVLESMALGTPVICSNTSSLPEVGEDALLYVDPNNFNDLKEKIKYFINNPKVSIKLSERGIEQSKKFDWKRSGIQLYKFLEVLINNA